MEQETVIEVDFGKITEDFNLTQNNCDSCDCDCDCDDGNIDNY